MGRDDDYTAQLERLIADHGVGEKLASSLRATLAEAPDKKRAMARIVSRIRGNKVLDTKRPEVPDTQ